MKGRYFTLALVGLLIVGIISSAEGKSKGSKESSCVSTCDQCKKECGNIFKSGYRCEISRPKRKTNDFCTCNQFGALPLCNAGTGTTQRMITSIGLMPLVFGMLYKTFI